MLEDPGGERVRRQGRIPAKLTQHDWLGPVKNNGCVGCHQLGQLATRTFPKDVSAPFAVRREEAWIRRVQSGQAGELMLNPLAMRARRRAVQVLRRLDRPRRQGRAAARASRRGRRASSATSSSRRGSGSTTKQYLHDLIASDRRYPDGQRLRPALRLARVQHRRDADPRSRRRTRSRPSRLPVRDADTPEAIGPGHAASDRAMAPSPYWGDEKLWDSKANNHNGMFDRTGPRVVRGGGARARQPGVLQEGLRPSLGQGLPARADEPPPHGARSEDHEVHVRRHVLRDASPAVRLRRQRHAVDQRRRAGRRLGQHEDVRRDRRRGEVAGLDGVRPRHQRQRPARRVRRAGPAGRSGEGQADRRPASTP